MRLREQAKTPWMCLRCYHFNGEKESYCASCGISVFASARIAHRVAKKHKERTLEAFYLEAREYDE